jgi:hypothetical protein
MAKTTHTPGPWTVDGHGQIVDRKGASILFSGAAVPMVPTDVSRANRKLAAASPDLLAALKDARAILKRLRYAGPEREVIDAAIARAEPPPQR